MPGRQWVGVECVMYVGLTNEATCQGAEEGTKEVGLTSESLFHCAGDAKKGEDEDERWIWGDEDDKLHTPVRHHARSTGHALHPPKSTQIHTHQGTPPNATLPHVLPAPHPSCLCVCTGYCGPVEPGQHVLHERRAAVPQPHPTAPRPLPQRTRKHNYLGGVEVDTIVWGAGGGVADA